MSSAVFSKQNPSSIPTRRPRTNRDNLENNSQRIANRRSISGTLRSLFRKSSASPTRTITNDVQRSPTPVPQRAPLGEANGITTEAPHLKAPTLYWPFGKKKAKSSSTNVKIKDSRKNKKPPIEVSSPVYPQEYPTSIYGQNFVPKTPEVKHGGTVRTPSASSYENTPKGFRDYTIIDHTNSYQQVITPDVPMITSHISDRSRSPSIRRSQVPDTNIEYPYQFDSSPPPLSDYEINSALGRHHKVTDIPSLTMTQMLAKQTPLVPQTSFPSTVNINPIQRHSTSSSSSTIADLHSTASSVRATDAPKLHVPSIPFGSGSSVKKSQRPNIQSHFDQIYNNYPPQSNLQYTTTYGSLPDGEMTYNGSLSSLKQTNSYYGEYPGLNAIVQEHTHPGSVFFDERSPLPTTPQRRQRFDASTTTFYDHDEPNQWTNTAKYGSIPSPSSLHRHDGYIRPLTPEKSLIQPDLNIIYVDHDRPASRMATYDSPESPTMYRSSTTVYTRDKQKYPTSGELRTWSAQENNDYYTNTQPSTSIQLVPARNYNEYQPEEERYEISYAPDGQIVDNHYFNHLNHDNTTNFTQSSTLYERDKIYDQPTRSYTYTERTQEPFYGVAPDRYSEVPLRHYSLKRSNSYDGLGILLTADAATRLNHRIRDVEPTSPGERVGLQKDDRLINVNGVNVENVEFNDVLLLIKEGLQNDNLQFSVANDSILNREKK